MNTFRKESPQKWSQLQVQPVQDYMAYCQSLLENSDKMRSTLKGITRHELSSAVRHNKGGPGNKEARLMRIYTVNMGNKNPV